MDACCVFVSCLMLSQEIGWGERFQNDLFCVGRDVKPYSVNLIQHNICDMLLRVWQEFCLFAVLGLGSDFFLQMFFFTTVLSIDIRRMEVSRSFVVFFLILSAD